MYSSSLDEGRHLPFESKMIQFGEPFQYHLYCVWTRLCRILLKLLTAPEMGGHLSPLLSLRLPAYYPRALDKHPPLARGCGVSASRQFLVFFPGLDGVQRGKPREG